MPDPAGIETDAAPHRGVLGSLIKGRRDEAVPEIDEIRDRSVRWASENPGVLATLGYLYLTSIGVAYSVLYYSLFGVSILDFSEPTDFLAAGIREPVLILFSFVSFAFLRRIVARERRWRAQWAWYRAISERIESHRFYSRGIIYAAVALAYFLAFAAIYSKAGEARVREGRGHRIVVDLNTAGTKSLGRDGRLELVGVNGRFLFLYSLANARTSIVPVSNVVLVTDYVAPLPAKAHPTGPSRR